MAAGHSRDDSLESSLSAVLTALTQYAAVFQRNCGFASDFEVTKGELNYQALQQNPDMEEPDRSFLVVALGLLSGLTHTPGILAPVWFKYWVHPLIERLIPILLHPKTRSRHKNAAVSVGRVGLTHQDIVPPPLPEFLWA
ncbi:hypothetical protein B0H13DRAFT_2359371 [Mycena leptocephala]|nr:hypothetical protein B0H13DRAFT_2359371 [Mycena leptocephala]